MTVLSVAADTNVFRFGTQSLKVTTGNTGDNALYPADAVNVVPGTAYTFSIYIKTSGVLGSGVLLRICQGGLLTPSLADSATVTDSSSYDEAVDGWYRLILTYTPAEGILTVRPIILYTGTTLGEIFWLDGIKFEEGDLASPWMQNIVSKRLVLDQGAVQVDASEGGLLRLRAATGGTRDTISLGDHGLLFGGDTELYSPAANVLALPDGDGLLIEDDGDITAIDQTTGIPFQIGPTAGLNTMFDANEIQARNNGVASSMNLNALGGEINVGDKIDMQAHSIKSTSATAFPASPVNNDVFWHNTYDMWFFYDGTRWVCTCPHSQDFVAFDTQPAYPLTATASARWGIALPVDIGLDIFIEHYDVFLLVASGGTALGASHKWVGTIATRATGTTISTINVDSGSSNVYRSETDANNDTVDLTAGEVGLTMTWTKTGTPGDLKFSASITYRYIGV